MDRALWTNPPKGMRFAPVVCQWYFEEYDKKRLIEKYEKDDTFEKKKKLEE